MLGILLMTTSRHASHRPSPHSSSPAVRASDNSAVLLCARSSGRQPNNRAALDLGAEGEQNGSVVLQAVLPNVVPPPCRPGEPLGWQGRLRWSF